jgi:hypothetical protein
MPRTRWRIESFDGLYGCSFDGISKIAGTADANFAMSGRMRSAIYARKCQRRSHKKASGKHSDRIKKCCSTEGAQTLMTHILVDEYNGDVVALGKRFKCGFNLIGRCVLCRQIKHQRIERAVG